MKRFNFWIAILISILITPICLMLAIASMGAGHGDYLFVIIFFPFTMLSTGYLKSITIPFVGLAFLQFPIYGLIIAISGKKQILAGILIAVVHIFTVIACFKFASSAFL